MEQNQGGFGFDMFPAEGQGPQLVAIGNGDILFEESAVYTWNKMEVQRKT